MDIKACMGLELGSFDQHGRYRRMMRDLFKVDWNSIERGMESLAKDGVERLLYSREAGAKEDEAQSDEFYLLDQIVSFDGLSDVYREEADLPGDCLEGGDFAVDLYRQGHVHDGFPGHDIGADLFGNGFDDAFLLLEDFFLAEDEFVTFDHPVVGLEEVVLYGFGLRLFELG